MGWGGVVSGVAPMQGAGRCDCQCHTALVQEQIHGHLSCLARPPIPLIGDAHRLPTNETTFQIAQPWSQQRLSYKVHTVFIHQNGLPSYPTPPYHPSNKWIPDGKQWTALEGARLGWVRWRWRWDAGGSTHDKPTRETAVRQTLAMRPSNQPTRTANIVMEGEAWPTNMERVGSEGVGALQSLPCHPLSANNNKRPG